MKILLTHMWMVIGGAETHVAELSKGLVSLGHDVTVASGGGVFVEELTKAGVKHFTVPLHTKNPFAMMNSYRKLKKLIKKEKFDIVHAHSRIPAFICGALSRRMGFRFVTSTHAVFKVNPLLERISDWGERTFAVSSDIKQYLIDNYGVPSDLISLTINGIDTERFSKNADSAGFINELNLKKDSFRVVYVSRIDRETALPGFLLCEAAEKIFGEIPNLEIVIVGGGTAYDDLLGLADKTNSKLGRNIIRLTGPRTDIASVLASADVFVGVSRAALEAMSEEKPIVLAGQEGYIGVLDESVMPLAKLTNFTCRGEKLPVAENIANDILKVYRMTAGERSALGLLGRSVVLSSYSVSKMVSDHVTVYNALAPYCRYKHSDIIISGYYGFNNIGDDSLLVSIISGIRERLPEAKITVLSKRPRHVSKMTGVRTVNRFNIPGVICEMRRAKLLISGGGSLLQDGTSRKSLYYYVYIMRLAKKMGLKLMIYANGLGPLGSPSSRRSAADIMSEADYISFREGDSLSLAREIGVSGEMKVTADPAFLLDSAPDLWVDHIIGREKIDRKYFLVSIKDGNTFDGADTDKNTLSVFAGDIRKISEKYSLMPLFLPMFPDRDTAITEQLAYEVGFGKVLKGLTAAELCGLLKRAEFVVGTRLHTLIFAASVGVPMIGISYDPKIDAFLEYIGEREHMLDIRSISENQLCTAVEAVITDSDKIRERLSQRACELRKIAEIDSDAVSAFLTSEDGI